MFTKKIITFSSFFLISVTLFAQQSVYQAFGLEKEQRWRFGVKAGVNLANIDNYQSLSNSKNDIKTAFHIGLTTEYKLTDYLYFEPSLLFSLKGTKSKTHYRFEETYIDINNRDEYGNPDPIERTRIVEGNIKEKINMYYLDIPIHLAYRFHLSEACHLDLQFGPYFAVGLFGKTKTYDDRYGSTVQFTSDSFKRKSMFIRTDMGISGGVTVGLFDHYRVGVNYQHGLTSLKDNVERNEKEPKNTNWMISLGYIF